MSGNDSKHPVRENDVLAVLPELFRTGDSSVIVGCGPDDCAHVAVGGCEGGRLAFSTDAFAEGSHFLPEDSPKAVARKSLLASLSDLAASACRPRWALVSLCVKKGAPGSWAAEFAGGIAEAAREYGVSIVGGDLISSGRGTFVSVTVAGDPLPGGPLLRSGGRAGDAVVVTGELGGSIRGKHLAPRPRTREIAALMEFAHISGVRGQYGSPGAAMDISDGLALDLSRLCRESGAGAVIEERAIPLSDAAKASARESGRSPVAHALSDGEDFELLLTMPRRLWDAFAAFLAGPEAPDGLARFTRIGIVTESPALLLTRPDGSVCPLGAEGYQHQW